MPQIETIFFDLDDTLYDKDSGVWQGTRARIERYMRERLALPGAQVATLRQEYLEKYGSSLRGLLNDYQIDPDEYLIYVHDMPIEEMIPPNPHLEQMLDKLPQRKWIFTNASVLHSERVLAALGVRKYFDGIIDIKVMSYQGKPDGRVYKLALEKTGTPEPANALFLDDQAVNLQPAKDLGANTVLVGNNQTNPAADLVIAKAEDLLAEWPTLIEFNHG